MAWPDRCELLVIIMLILGSMTVARAQKWSFDASQLGGNISADTVDMFNAGGQPPGVYHVRVYLNTEQVDETDIPFNRDTREPGAALRACLSEEQLRRWGIRLADDGHSSGRHDCVALSTISEDAGEEFDFAGQRLQLNIPQAYLMVHRPGEVPTALWDDGVPAFLLGWQGNINRVEPRRGRASEQLSRFVRLTSGINVGPWRLRNASNWQKEHGASGRWQSAWTRIERGFYALRSRLTLGESTTSADVFDSIPFAGVMLSSDDAMASPGMTTFTPVIRGIARTQARVVVRQNGEMLYTREVPPGPFALDNLPVPGAGGVLDVSVEESSGDVQRFSVPWQTPAVALHEGYTRYSLMAGRFAMDGLPSVPAGQFTIMSGLPGNMTLYGGGQQSQHYSAVAAGLGVSLGAAGSLSTDITRAAHRDGRGRAVRLRYSKSLDTTDTQVSVELSRYASGYRTLSESISGQDRDGDPNGQRQRMALTLAQPLGRVGNLSISASSWRDGSSGSHTRSGNISYSVALSGVTLTLNWARNGLRRGNEWKTDRTLALGLSYLFGGTGAAPVSATFQASQSASQGDSRQVTLSGQGAGGQLFWTAAGSASRPEASRPGDRSATLMTGWRGAYGQMTGHYGQNDWSQQAGAGLSGGLALTQYGLASGQTAEGTLALVAAPGAAGTRVSGRPGISTNPFGLALIPVSPYRKNSVRLDTLSLGQDAEIIQSEARVIPTQRAVVPAVFEVRRGGRGLVTLQLPSGQHVPFGAVVSQTGEGDDAGQSEAGIVGEGGVAFLSGLGDAGTLSVKWGRTAAQRCTAPWRLPEAPDNTGLYQLTVVCR